MDGVNKEKILGMETGGCVGGGGWCCAGGDGKNGSRQYNTMNGVYFTLDVNTF